MRSKSSLNILYKETMVHFSFSLFLPIQRIFYKRMLHEMKGLHITFLCVAFSKLTKYFTKLIFLFQQHLGHVYHIFCNNFTFQKSFIRTRASRENS